MARRTDLQETRSGSIRQSPASVDYARTPGIVRRGLGRHEVEMADSFGSRRADGACWPRQRLEGVVLVVDAKKERVAGRYAGHGAVPLLDEPLSLLLLPLATNRVANPR